MLLKKNSKFYVLKNLTALNVSFVLLYAASNCIISIQAVLNQAEGLGTISQTVTFASNILTALILPQLIRELLGFKLALVLGELLVMAYVAVQIYPTWFTFIPSNLFFSNFISPKHLKKCIFFLHLDFHLNP